MIHLVNSSFQTLPLTNHKMMFADPPDNIGLDYDGYEDTLPAHRYRSLLEDILLRARLHCDILWISFNAIHLPLMGSVVYEFLNSSPSRWPADDYGEWVFKPGVQTYTFYQHNRFDLGAAHRPLWRLMKKGTKLYPDAVRVPSWRQLHGDKRANPAGKVPGDVFDFPRVVGNAGQRRTWHPTQLNEGLYERCLKLSCAPNESACDLFAGTGTLARVCAETGNPCSLYEIDPGYCEQIALEHKLHQITPTSWISEEGKC